MVARLLFVLVQMHPLQYSKPGGLYKYLLAGKLSQLRLNSAKLLVQHNLRVTIHAVCICCVGILSRCIRSIETDVIITRATYCIQVKQNRSMRKEAVWHTLNLKRLRIENSSSRRTC